MAAIAVQVPEWSLLSFNRMRNRHKDYKISASWRMTMDSTSSQTRKEELSLQLSSPQVPQFKTSSPSSLRFDRLQPFDQVLDRPKIEFGRFVARKVALDEEYWTAAWLRAESLWEDRSHERYVDSFKRKYAEEEFNALKRRCKDQHGQKCACIVTVDCHLKDFVYDSILYRHYVKKEGKNIKRTVLKSVVGTLDLNIRYLLQGETFPGERVKAPLFCSIDRTDPSKYGYVSNLCVAKSARRQGVASNMLHFAVESARSDGVEQVFVHVNRDNEPAQELYRKMGFEIVESASSQLIEKKTYLLRIKMS